MGTDDKTPEGRLPDLGIHPRAEVTQAVSVAPEAVSGPSETQAFMARMAEHNAAEFAEVKRKRDDRLFWLTWSAMAVVSIIIIGLDMAGVI